MIPENTLVRPLTIDLRVKSLEAVVDTLRAGGYTVLVSETQMWEWWDKQKYGQNYVSPPVHVIWIKGEEAPNLTCITFSGKKITLTADQDLHLMDHPAGQLGQDWCVVNSGHVMA